MSDPLATISTRRTPQTEQADPRQVKNHGGGYTFVIDDLARLRRFLTLGTTGGTYYTGERELTTENAALILDLARTRTADLVAAVVEISTSGRAPKQNPALFALAAAAKLGDDEGRKAAQTAVPLVARTGTHLFQFTKYLEQFGGWGRGTRRAVGNWYVDPERSVQEVAYQLAKYQQREGWSHRDLLRLAHPTTTEPARKRLLDWVMAGRSAGDRVAGDLAGSRQAEVQASRHAARGSIDLSGLPVIAAYERAQVATSAKELAGIISTNPGLSWEMLPDQFINEPVVWEALLGNGMPQTALMRQLPRLTRLGMLEPLGNWATKVAAQLSDPERLRKGRVHPINVLVAQRTYASGMSARGSSTWTPSRPIVDALDAAFYAAYSAIEPSGKRMMLSLDVSGSMSWYPLSNMPITPREASAALALVTAATEPTYELNGFSHGLVPLAISPRQRLADAIKAVSDLPASYTDCAQPMLHAMQKNLNVDTFVVYTDNETNARVSMHPHQALQQYRQKSGIDARLIVVAMTATDFTIADPSDPGMLDVAGFDSAVPSLISDFARGL